MFIEVVHVNGQYSQETGEHSPPHRMPEGYYAKLASALAHAAARGASITYRPNLSSFTRDTFADQGAVYQALATDPLLAALAEHQVSVAVHPDGELPLEMWMRLLSTEDELLRREGRGVVLGAYATECVPTVAHDMSARNPGYPVAIDPALSIDRGAPLVSSAHASIPHIFVADFGEAK